MLSRVSVKQKSSAEAVSVTANPNTYHQFSPQFVRDLLSMYRIMFPHEDVPDEAYERVVRKLDERAAQDQVFALLLSDGVATLNRETEHKLASLCVEARAEALRGLEQTLFFKRLRQEFVTWFYSNPRVWSRFGYEGPSNDKGGYIHRGLNDIDWLDRAEG